MHVTHIACDVQVKGRIKDLETVTSLPSFLQENRGFKSQELSEQAEYETSDDVADKPARHWLINDLVLFIDNEDMPRIPRKLFEDVCRINVAGVPGPIYRGHLDAMKQFLRIVVFIFFVFIIILSFGSLYRVHFIVFLLYCKDHCLLCLLLEVSLSLLSTNADLALRVDSALVDVKNFARRMSCTVHLVIMTSSV